MIQVLQQNTQFQYKGAAIHKSFYRLSHNYLREPILDIGAGHGAILKDLTHRGYRKCYGIDLKPAGLPVTYGDCTLLTDWRRQGIRTVICTDVLEHLSNEDLQRTLDAVWEVLPVGGYFIITTIHNEQLEDNTVTCPECNTCFHRMGHCQIFTVNRLVSLLNQFGFDVVKAKKANLHLLSNFPLLAGLFYGLRFDILRSERMLSSDLFVVGCKRMKETGR
ncbi:MAG: class I SAM-dependent methyltransferase [Planctomycetota bacterium]|jgi:SAM-dependent methyltransferase